MKTLVKAAAIVIFSLLAWEAHAACNVSTTSVNFGNYDVFLATPLDSTGTVTVWCDENLNQDLIIGIGPSGNSGGFQPRKMRPSSGSDLLDYNLYTNSFRTAVWGNGTAGTSTVNAGKIKKNDPPTSVTIFGRVPPGQNVSVGTYSDTLVVTITW